MLLCEDGLTIYGRARDLFCWFLISPELLESVVDSLVGRSGKLVVVLSEGIVGGVPGDLHLLGWQLILFLDGRGLNLRSCQVVEKIQHDQRHLFMGVYLLEVVQVQVVDLFLGGLLPHLADASLLWGTILRPLGHDGSVHRTVLLVHAPLHRSVLLLYRQCLGDLVKVLGKDVQEDIWVVGVQIKGSRRLLR